MRKIFGSKKDEVRGEWRALHNEKLCDVYSSLEGRLGRVACITYRRQNRCVQCFCGKI